jgi:hypothetical protein
MTAGAVLALLGVGAVSFEATWSAVLLWTLAFVAFWHGG